MRLTSVQVTNFRCIEDSTAFDVGEVTCLVGKNESGKTTILQALNRLNPQKEAEGKFDKDYDYPRRFVNEYGERHADRAANVVTSKWALDDADRAALRAVLGDATDALDTVTISKGYDNQPQWNVDVDEEDVVEHLLAMSSLHAEERDALVEAKTVAALKGALEGLAAAATERHAALVAMLNKHFKRGTASLAAVEVLSGRLPKFVYFSQYQQMAGRVALEATQARIVNKQPLEPRENTFLEFCAFAGSSLDELASIQNFEKLTSKFEGASNRITAEIFEYWTQNQNLQVQFSRDAGEPQDPPPFNSGRVFNVRIRNDLHQVSVPFDDRSAGFVWFFSFLVLFSQVKKTLGENLILLLDEPGLSLHAKAQDDLLRFIDERLAPHHQVIYTTHSPFLVPAKNLPAVRTVEDVVEERAKGRPIVRGTKVRSDVLNVHKDTLFPVQSALGYEITQSLFVGRNTLIVEGPSDLLYLHAYSQELKAQNRTSLDPRWVICPVGGIDKVPAFLALFGANKLNLAVLVDLAKGQKGKVEEVKRLAGEVLRSGQVFTPAQYTGGAEGDVEDLLGADGYLHLVNLTYGLQGASVVAAPPSAASRIVKYVEDQLRVRPSLPDFNHYTPAEYLTVNRSSALSALPGAADALDRFERLFKDLNTLTATT